MLDLGFVRVLYAVAVLAVGGIVSPVASQGAPEDEPAIEQYADPFGPLPTRERARDFNPLSDDFAVPPAPKLLRQLERVDEANRAPLAALVSQVATARKRVRGAAGAEASWPRRESDSGALYGLAASLFDPGGAGGWLLAAAAAVAVAAAVRAKRIRRR